MLSKYTSRARELGIIYMVDEFDRFVSRTTYYRLSTGKFLMVFQGTDGDMAGITSQSGTLLAYSGLPTALKISIEKRVVLRITQTKIEVKYA